jgi:hypothetical protein
MADDKGVVEVPLVAISASIERHVQRALAEVPAGKNGALVAVATEGGVNLAVAHRAGDDWTVAAWIGKDWRGPVEGGAYVKRTW